MSIGDVELVTPGVAETHISWVLTTGDRALKIYKPVRTDVLDHRDVDRRRLACIDEIDLNRRMAPDVYEGLAEIMLGDEGLEPVIVMRRMPAARRLSTLLGRGDSSCIRAVARRIAAFHASLEPLGHDDACSVSSPTALQARWAADVAGLRDLVHDDGVAERIDEIEARSNAYLVGREPLLAARIEDGLVRDGHGDLLADDIFCLDDGPRILDCLAFADELRWGDVLADVAFLVMDLQRLGHPESARDLLRWYCEYTAEHHPGSLAHLYVAQRALVRAKVTALGTGYADDAVRGLVGMVLDHLRRAQVRIVLVGGLPGAGKSTVAEGLGARLGWTVLSSDAVRRDLGLRFRDLGDARAYDADTVARVYAELRDRAERLLAQGLSVVLDATWTSGREREQVRELGKLSSAELVELECRAPLPACRARVGRRSVSESEATPDVVDLLHAIADPWPEAAVVDTSEATLRTDVRPTNSPWWVAGAAQTRRY